MKKYQSIIAQTLETTIEGKKKENKITDVCCDHQENQSYNFILFFIFFSHSWGVLEKGGVKHNGSVGSFESCHSCFFFFFQRTMIFSVCSRESSWKVKERLIFHTRSGTLNEKKKVKKSRPLYRNSLEYPWKCGSPTRLRVHIENKNDERTPEIMIIINKKTRRPRINFFF